MGTTSEKLTYLNTTKGKIKDSINLTGANITTEPFRQYSTKLEDAYVDIINNGTDTLYNNFPKVSGEGTSLTLNNTYQAPMRNNLKGNTSQTGTPTPTSPIPVNVVSGDNEINVIGKNLFDKTRLISGKRLDNTGLPSITDNSYCTTDYFIGVKPSTTYYSTSAINQSKAVCFYDSNRGFIERKMYLASSTFTTGATTYYIKISILLSEIDTEQLEKGSSASTFEPYIGNTYNIDLPVENLLPPPSSDSSSTGAGNMSLTWNTNNEYKLSGNATSSANVVGGTIATDYTIKEGDYLHLCNDSTPSGVIQFVGLTPQSAQAFVVTINSKNKVLDLTSYVGKTIHSVFFYCVSGASADMTMTPMIVNGMSKVLSFTPYGTTPIELCKIGTYQDYFYKDSDKWYLHKEIGKVVLNGSELWQIHGSIASWFYYDGLENVRYAISENLAISNYYSYKPYYPNATTIVNGEFTIGYGANNIGRVVMKNTDYTTVNDFRTWLSTHNTSLYYILATPTNTEITDTTLINQLKQFYQAQSKNNQTNISQINNALGFIISASALKKG